MSEIEDQILLMATQAKRKYNKCQYPLLKYFRNGKYRGTCPTTAKGRRILKSQNPLYIITDKKRYVLRTGKTGIKMVKYIEELKRKYNERIKAPIIKPIDERAERAERYKRALNILLKKDQQQQQQQQEQEEEKEYPKVEQKKQSTSDEILERYKRANDIILEINKEDETIEKFQRLRKAEKEKDKIYNELVYWRRFGYLKEKEEEKKKKKEPPHEHQFKEELFKRERQKNYDIADSKRREIYKKEKQLYREEEAKERIKKEELLKILYKEKEPPKEKEFTGDKKEKLLNKQYNEKLKKLEDNYNINKELITKNENSGKITFKDGIILNQKLFDSMRKGKNTLTGQYNRKLDKYEENKKLLNKEIKTIKEEEKEPPKVERDELTIKQHIKIWRKEKKTLLKKEKKEGKTEEIIERRKKLNEEMRNYVNNGYLEEMKELKDEYDKSGETLIKKRDLKEISFKDYSKLSDKNRKKHIKDRKKIIKKYGKQDEENERIRKNKEEDDKFMELLRKSAEEDKKRKGKPVKF